MINLYPANKMENLLVLLNKISQISPLGVFNQEVIIVQNAGMQHWLNLAIADERGISMNMRYALPAQYLWQLIRGLASAEKVPEQSPYSRNVLTWRIYQLLADEKVIKDDDFKAATHYWFTGCNETNNDLINTKEITRKASLKRYQLAEQMADLYEQYLIFRPDWLDAWEKENNIDLMPTEQLSSENKWQAKLWLLLIEQLPYNPVELLNDAIANITDKLALDPKLLPKRLSFFGINTMAPMWLNFINALSEHIDVNFFHLNPCFSYWGDIISEKQALKQLSHWSTEVDNEHLLVGNPLLANFGQQGREFLALLQDYSTVNVELFVKASNEQSNNNQKHAHKHEYSILHSLQNDILALEDARDNTTHQLEPLIDDSITIVSCHSALREVQALHDFLLHQFNDNKTPLTPKDVLVMCPQIEQYAPYVNAVFAKGWQDLNDEVPPLPCSIADRSAKDSDPLIAAFSELLTLPDSRFQVSQLLGFIRLPAIANKFSMNTEDCEKISLWLEQACVHWGLDQTHKEKILGEKASNSF
ncbi:MAG: exodeoxyribonuclease V subunit gamma, partial [Colwellia sp.]